MNNLCCFNQYSPEILYLCKKDKDLAKLINMIGPLSYETHNDPFIFLIHEIIEQMLSVKAANKIYSRLEVLCGGKITPIAISKLNVEDIKSIGTSSAKANCIIRITSAVINGELVFDHFQCMTDTQIIKQLTSFRGIGNWTAKMYLIFVLNRYDILPYEDAAFKQSYCWLYNTEDTKPNGIINKCKKWKPYSSIAARYLYLALDRGLTKQ